MGLELTAGPLEALSVLLVSFMVGLCVLLVVLGGAYIRRCFWVFLC